MRFAYLQQVVALGSMMGFNLLVPAVAGLETFGRFTVAQGVIMLVTGLAGGGLDLVLTRDIRADDGSIDPHLFWRALALRLAVSLGAMAVLMSSPVSIWLDSARRSGVPSWLMLASTVAIATSAHCISTVIGAMATRSAAKLSAAHAVPYFAVPLILHQLVEESAQSLMIGVLTSYVFIIALECVVLRGLTWSARTPSSTLLGLAWQAVSVSPNSLFETARTWGAILLASMWLPPGQIGVARTAFSIAAAMTSLTPVPIQALVAMGSELEQAYRTSARLAATLRHSGVLAALTGAVAVAAYAGLMPSDAGALYARCAAGVMLLVAVGPMSRLALALASAQPSGRAGAIVLACAVAAMMCGAAGALALGPAGMLLGTAVAALPLVLIMPATMRSCAVHRSSAVFAAGSALLVAAVGSTGRPALVGGMAAAAALAYLVWQRRDLGMILRPDRRR